MQSTATTCNLQQAASSGPYIEDAEDLDSPAGDVALNGGAVDRQHIAFSRGVVNNMRVCAKRAVIARRIRGRCSHWWRWWWLRRRRGWLRRRRGRSIAPAVAGSASNSVYGSGGGREGKKALLCLVLPPHQGRVHALGAVEGRCACAQARQESRPASRCTVSQAWHLVDGSRAHDHKR